MGDLKPKPLVKALAVSDTVIEQLHHPDVRRRFPEVSLLIGCGDLPFYYLDFLISAFDMPLVYVRGNHDGGPQHLSDGRIIDHVQGGVDLHARVVLVRGLLMAGLEGSMRYRADGKYMYTEAEMRVQVARLLPKVLLAQLRHGRRLDVLVTHSPPFGIHDDRDLAHTGFRIFLPMMHWLRPRYLLHGHVHKIGANVPHRTLVGETTVINVFPYRQLELAAGHSGPISA